MLTSEKNNLGLIDVIEPCSDQKIMLTIYKKMTLTKALEVMMIPVALTAEETYTVIMYSDKHTDRKKRLLYDFIIKILSQRDMLEDVCIRMHI